MEKAIFLQIFDAKSIKSPLINISQIALHQMNANGQMLRLQIKLTGWYGGSNNYSQNNALTNKS
jgi:hypothetical protein